jgi:hypothetical protein
MKQSIMYTYIWWKEVILAWLNQMPGFTKGVNPRHRIEPPQYRFRHPPWNASSSFFPLVSHFTAKLSYKRSSKPT